MEQADEGILVIIPAYNEEDTIADVISDITVEQPAIDILVVNDGSSDRTSRVVKEAGGVRLIEHTFNMGVGAAVQTGYRYAVKHGYSVAVQVDADGQHLASELYKIIEPVLSGSADVVVGSRFLGHGDYKASVVRGVGIGFFASVVSTIIGRRITDPSSGFRATGRRALFFLSEIYPEDYPEVEALVLLHKKGLRIEEVPVTMAPRQGGKSSITTSRGIYYMVKVLLAIFVDLLKKIK
ncbi:Glycosyl transferase, family 2 [hydrothermal vent metagenome]|uniref:Glycosyl transferase, family 2 n=1 Tax=hydrothermal vent metagenome TaxID=652676 RepID=A0A3B0QQL6_9ZZZZ